MLRDVPPSRLPSVARREDALAHFAGRVACPEHGSDGRGSTTTRRAFATPFASVLRDVPPGQRVGLRLPSVARREEALAHVAGRPLGYKGWDRARGCHCEIEIMNENNEKSDQTEQPPPPTPGKLFLLVVLVSGMAATWASAQWLSSGAITIRAARTRGAPPVRGGEAFGQITAEQALFYPLCITWASLGVAMITLAGLAFVLKKPLLMKLSAYCCAGILPLGFATLLAVWLLNP